MFQVVDPAPYRWMGEALAAGAMPRHDRAARNVDALKRILDLPLAATDEEVNRELLAFMKHGKRRT